MDFETVVPFVDFHIDSLCRAVYCDSPISLVAINEFRKQAQSLGDLGAFTEVDRFLLAQGEPSAPHVTKYGGVPHRPAHQSWPIDDDGQPMTFVAQFCFSDSVIRAVPNDVLIVFVRAISSFFTSDLILVPNPYYGERAVVTEWHPLRLDDPCTAADVPAVQAPIPRCFGVRYRSLDYLSVEQIMPLAVPLIRGSGSVRDELRKANLVRALFTHPRMKIGGVPLVEESLVPADAEFLCAFAGVSLASEVPFPWVNRKSPIRAQEEFRDDHHLMFRDSGDSVNLFQTKDGKTEWILGIGS